MCSSSKGSAVNLSLTTASVSSVGTFVNTLTTSRPTIWLERMGASLIPSTKWPEFLTYDKDLPARGLMIFTWKRLNGWHSVPRLLIMGLNRIPSSCIFGRPYMCYSLLECWVCCLYFICGIRTFLLLRICDSFLSIFRVGSFFTLQ